MSDQGRESLTMETAENQNISFRKGKGRLLTICSIGLLALFVLAAILATGFLVYFLTNSELAQGQKVHSAPRAGEPIEASQPSYRLPPALIPLHYFVRLQPFLNGNFSIHGYTEIRFQAVENTTQVILHIKDILTKNETLRIYDLEVSQNNSLHVVNQTYDNTTEFYIISLRDELEEGKKYVMHLQFIGYLNDKLKGLYRSSYVDAEGIKRWQAATQFQATRARMAFPCFDEPQMKAEFTIELVRQEGLSSISNMPLLETTPVVGQNGWFADKFDKSVKMSTYLVAFLISDFQNISTETSTGTTVRVWARGDSIHQAHYALRMGKELLVFFEEYFNITYPLTKLDMAALPDFSGGAMENWGLVFYREMYLLYDSDYSSFTNKRVIGSFIAHELAHQWFGNLVTPYWWTDLWLNEGFATFMGYMAYDFVEPRLQISESFVSTTLRSALIADALENSHPISIEVGHPDEISEIFDSISYSKGASVIQMMSSFLTESTFRKGVTNFLNAFAYSTAKQDDLWHFLTLQAEADQTLPANVTVKEIMDTWTLQMGFPVINVTLHENNQTATLTQEYFLSNRRENSTSEAKDLTWWVPITYTSEADPNFSSTYPQQWMEPSEVDITLEGMPPGEDWLIFNVLQTGVYRVNYELDNWNKLIAQLSRNHSAIDSRNRVQITGDAFQLAKADLIPYAIPLSLTLYLGNETDNVPLFNAIKELEYIEKTLRDTSIHDTYKAFYLTLLIPHYEHVGFQAQVEDTLMTQEKRAAILPILCHLQYNPCIEQAKSLYREWMSNSHNKRMISPNIRSTVYCNGIREGGNKEWDFAWNQYANEDVATEKSKLLSALGCTRNITTKLKMLNLTFQAGGPIRKQDVNSAFSTVIKDKQSRVLAWNYLKENWNAIYDYVRGKETAILLINRATRSIKTDEELLDRDEFIAMENKLGKKGTRSLKQERENIIINIEWLRKNVLTLAQWLKEKGFENEDLV